MHLLASIERPGPYLEYSIEPDADYTWQAGMYEPRPEVVGGEVRIPEGPGWGVEISPDWLSRSEQRITRLD